MSSEKNTVRNGANHSGVASLPARRNAARLWRHARCALQAAVLVAGCAPAWVQARDMAVFFVEGEKPSRTVYAAAFTAVVDRTSGLSALMQAQRHEDYKKTLEQHKHVQMRVVGVPEGEGAPERLDFTVEFRCAQEQYRITRAIVLQRNGNLQHPGHDWRPLSTAPSAWPTAAAAVACNHDRVMKAARDAAHDQGDALAALGLIYIGNMEVEGVVELTWKTLLADGRRPAYTDRVLSEEEYRTKQEQMAAALDEARRQTAAALSVVGAARQDMLSEREFKALLGERQAKAGPQLRWLIGRTESEIVASAGPALRRYEADGTLSLEYEHLYDIAGVGLVRDANGVLVSQSTRVSCQLQIELRKGGSIATPRAVDYRLTAGNGGCRDLSWFNRSVR